MAASTSLIALMFLLFLLLSRGSYAQQQYTNNDMLDCYTKTNSTSVRGYVCGGGGASSCLSYLFFRSNPPIYNTPVQIAYLLSASPQNISDLNAVTDVTPLPAGRPVIVPVTCSCVTPDPRGPSYYQYDSRYILKWDNETYQIVANDTYQGLTTCQAMMAQNPAYDSRNLSIHERLKAPLRCACPTAAQIKAGFRYLLTYIVNWTDDIPSIASTFRTDPNAVLAANGLDARSTIFPFTTILVPLKEQPTSDLVPWSASSPSVPSDASPATPTGSSGGGSGKGKKWVAAGIGIGVGFLALLVIFGAVFAVMVRRRRQIRRMEPYTAVGSLGGAGVKAQRSGNESYPLSSFGTDTGSASLYGSKALTTSSTTPSTAALSDEARLLASGALAVYKFSDLEKATGFFGETHRISGSVYKGVINGDTAAVKRMKGDVSKEVAIVKRFNHSSLVRLSGFCVHAGDTYLVFEYAEHGSLSDWFHSGGERTLTWKRRVQVAHDVADGLNYLHNYASPPCVHKDLGSSNVLLDREFRAKLSNFGLARSVSEDDGGPPQLTRHVVGTQGYMPPEYLEHGLISPKMDIFALGVVILELLSGRDAVTESKGSDGEVVVSLLWEEISPLMAAEDVRERLSGFIDPRLHRDQYPFDAAFNMAQLARRCVARDPAARPTSGEVFVTLSAVHSATLDWEPLSGSEGPESMVYPR